MPWASAGGGERGCVPAGLEGSREFKEATPRRTEGRTALEEAEVAGAGGA